MRKKFLTYSAFLFLALAVVMQFFPTTTPEEAQKIEAAKQKKKGKSFIFKNNDKRKMMTEEEAKEYVKNQKKINIISFIFCGIFLVFILIRNRRNL